MSLQKLMKAPREMLYIDEDALTGLLQDLEGRSLVETSNSTSRETGESLKAGASGGGGFLAAIGLGKLSLGLGKKKRKGESETYKFQIGPRAYLSHVIELLQERKEPWYFESLDDAFALAPKDGKSFVCVRDEFALANLGADLSLEEANREQRFLFEIKPAPGGHTNQDDYYKRPPRKWHLLMAASFEKCPRLRGKRLGSSSHEALYFQNVGYHSIPLNVFGCYLKAGLRANIFPYAIWY